VNRRLAGLSVAQWGLATIVAAIFIAISTQPWSPVQLLEAIGFLLGVWWVWLLIQESPWNWPIGILNSSIYVVVMLQAKVYGDAALNALYIVLGFIGWYWWVRGDDGRTPVPISYSRWKLLALLSALALAAAWVLFPYFRNAGSTVALPDALLFSFSMVGQYLQTRKKIENWPVWVVVNFCYIPVFITKHLPATAVLYGIYGLLAIQGWREWLRLFQVQNHPNSPEISPSTSA
jgi:nicotinamide mononucleotide transporter